MTRINKILTKVEDANKGKKEFQKNLLRRDDKNSLSLLKRNKTKNKIIFFAKNG